MALITVVLKDEETKLNNTVKHVISYNSDIAPRIGEYVEVDGHPPYEVDRIIHRPSHKSSITIVEVKEAI